MKDGYAGEIESQQIKVTAALEELVGKVIEGCREEVTLQPLTSALSSAIDLYNTQMRAIRSVLVPKLHS